MADNDDVVTSELAGFMETSEYAGEMGAKGMPAYIDPNASSACSISLPERIAIGRSLDNGRWSNASATFRADARICA